VDEQTLISRARTGDGAAWEQLIAAHREAMFRLAYLLLSDADEADDAAQDACIRAFGALDRFDSSRPLRPWLLRIVTNLAHNRRRSASRYLALLQRAWSREPDPIDEPGADCDAQMLWQAVRRLQLRDQQIIYLRYFLDLSEGETAAALDVAVGTIKSRTHRALQRLRGVVDREFPQLREASDV
jgi:RNA polymerase sigma-70 factor, ECF subfamily